MTTAPAITTKSEHTVAKTGRRMKKSTKPEVLWFSTVGEGYLSTVTDAPSARLCPPETISRSPALTPSRTT